MARKWTRDVQLVIVGLFLTVFSIVFVLAPGPFIGRLIALGFALLFSACTIGAVLPLLGLAPRQEVTETMSLPHAALGMELSGPVITSVKGLGEMRRVADTPEWLGSEPVRVELFEGKLLQFIIETEEMDLASSWESIESAVAKFLALNGDRREGITELLYKNYEIYIQGWDSPPSEVKIPSDLWRYVYPDNVYVRQRLKDKDFYIVVWGECGWEPEHGLEMVFKHGDQIVSVGQVGDWS